MALELLPLDEPSDWPELGRCLHESYTNPTQEIYKLLRPTFDDSPDGTAQAVKRYTERMKNFHENEPGSVWYKVVDTKTRRIIAGAWYKIFTSNPFNEPNDTMPTAWPEGGQREFATQALKIFHTPQETLFNRPHIYLSIIFTHPDHRKRGAADMLIRWGIAKAAEMGLPMWLDAFPFARDVYPRYGFHPAVGELKIKPEKEDPDPDWRRAEQLLLPLSIWPMWRPKDGPFVEGKSIPPWKDQS